MLSEQVRQHWFHMDHERRTETLKVSGVLWHIADRLALEDDYCDVDDNLTWRESARLKHWLESEVG